MRLAVTGYGIACAAGVGREAFEAALEDPERAAAAATEGASEVLPAEAFASARTAEVRGFDAASWLGPKGLRNFDRLTKFLITAAKLALEDAGVKRDGAFVALGPSQVGICSATAYGSLEAIHELQKVASLEDPRYINPQRFPNTVINAAAGYVSIWETLEAPNTTIVDGNCGSLDAVLSAATHLQHHRGDAFLVGGGEVVSEPLSLALDRLGVLARAGGGDEGLVPGEGGAYLLVERPDDAAARGAHTLAEIVGYGSAFEPPSREGAVVHGSAHAVRAAMEGALAEARVAPAEVDVVASAHGGLAFVDAAEAEGIRQVFGDQVAIAAPKRLTGESFGAAGAMAMVAALGWLAGRPVGPRIAGKPPARVRHVLVNTVGFYGNVSSVLLRGANA